MRKSILCYMDCLGIKAMSTADAAEASNSLKRLHKALKKARSRYIGDKDFSDGHSVTWFTDNVVVAIPLDHYPDTELPIGLLTIFIAWFQYDMAIEGFFFRGAITLGDVCVTQKLAFGPALIEAVDLEQCHSVQPRVVVSRSAQIEIGKHLHSYSLSQSPFATTLAVDAGTTVFINYLALTAGELDDFLYDGRLLIKRHREQVVTELAKCDVPAVVDKYRWLANFHNTCASRMFPEDLDLLIDIPDPSTEVQYLGDLSGVAVTNLLS